MDVNTIRGFMSNDWLPALLAGLALGSSILPRSGSAAQQCASRFSHESGVGIDRAVFRTAGPAHLLLRRTQADTPRLTLAQGLPLRSPLLFRLRCGRNHRVFLATGLLSLGNTGVALVTFCLAYLCGYGMTLGPLLQAGTPLQQALRDTFYSDTATIAVMEMTAIGLDLWLAAAARPGDVLFWTSLLLSLTAGLIVAYPVNILLVHLGVKGGMANPRETATGMSGQVH